MKVIITCEHGGNRIPEEYKEYFKGAEEDLNSHKGFDAGALEIFSILKDKFSDFATFTDISRLLADTNRILTSQNLFSKYTNSLNGDIRKKILEDYYYPYRASIQNSLRNFTRMGETVVHISVHTFTPVLDNVTRKNDIGLLFEPDNDLEREFCVMWKKAVEKYHPRINIMFNYPYTGNKEGLTKYLREQYPYRYAGIELEINQRIFENDIKKKVITEIIIVSLQESLNSFCRCEVQTRRENQTSNSSK